MHDGRSNVRPDARPEATPLLRAPQWAFQMLRQARVARLGTADADATPLVVPVCFVFDGRACYTPVDGKPKRGPMLRRLANIAANPRATLLLDDYDEDWRKLRWVMVHGRAAVITDGDEVERVVALLREKYPQYAEVSPLAADGGAVIELQPARVASWRWEQKGATRP